MIEINLIPDVKLELLKARRQRKMVITGSIFVAIISGGLVVLLSLYAFGIQTVADNFAQSNIDKQSKKLKQVRDLSKTLTIQNQLDQIDKSQRDKTVTSRLFDIINVTTPEGNNAISVKRLAFNDEDHTVAIEGEAPGGYESLEVFKKTIDQTTFQYTTEGEAKEVKLVNAIADGERRYSDDNQGKRVLRFAITLTVLDELFSPDSENGRIIGPTKQRATDSAQGVPTSLFSGGNE